MYIFLFIFHFFFLFSFWKKELLGVSVLANIYYVFWIKDSFRWIAFLAPRWFLAKKTAHQQKLDVPTSFGTNIPALLYGPRDRMTSHDPAIPVTNRTAPRCYTRCGTSLVKNVPALLHGACDWTNDVKYFDVVLYGMGHIYTPIYHTPFYTRLLH